MATKRSLWAAMRWRPPARRASAERGLPWESTSTGNGPAPSGLNTVTSMYACSTPETTGTRMTSSVKEAACAGKASAKSATASHAPARRR